MYLLTIIDEGQRFQVTGVREFGHDVSYHPDRNRECAQDVFEFVKANISSNKITFLDNPSVVNPEISDLDLAPLDETENLRANALNYFRQGELAKSLDADFYLTFLEFIQLNNYMCSKGYFFTDENREELYLDILNTGDPVLIAKLEDFLAVYDEISIFDSSLEDYRQSRKAMNDMTSPQEIRTYFQGRTGRDISDVFKID